MKAEDYKKLFQKLMPYGPAWSRNPKSLMAKLAKAVGDFFYYLYETIELAFVQAFIAEDNDFPQIRDYDNIANKDYWQAVCNYFGVKVQIIEYSPFMFSVSECGTDQCGPENIIFHWNIVILSGTDENIEKMKKYIFQNKFAHTVITFFDERTGENYGSN